MAREQNLYQIFKFTSTFICENDLNVKSYSIAQAIKDGCLVSVGDNIAFDQIRRMHGDYRTSKEIFDGISGSRYWMKKAKEEGDTKMAGVYDQYIHHKLFVPDIISVEAINKSEYRKLAKAGFYVNGKRYVRFSASAGQIRHNTVLFCNDEIYDQLFKALMCGLETKVKEINIAKLSAYFSLSTSSVLWVSEPRVCVMKDFNTVIPDQKIDWITNTESGKKTIEERIMDVELNSADGQGLISPDEAIKWSEEMGLDYVASSYVVRSIFVKGNLVPFDFRAYAHENGIDTITDKWGVTYNVDDIDVILSESQFKMHKYYKSWQEYQSYTHANAIKWGVARYNKKVDPEMSLTNYQYIQIMNIDEKDVKMLIYPTVKWIKQICSGDPLYSLLYCFGGFNNGQDVGYNDVYTRAQNLAMKAVVKNPEFLKDTYVQRKIYKNIIETINRAKLGKIWMRGNYQFMISDPIAQCRSALGLSPEGEIPADHVYCKFWLDRGLEGNDVVCLRSPCLDKHEANPCTVYASEQTLKWYQYIQSGLVYSIYDTSVLRHSDSDLIDRPLVQ